MDRQPVLEGERLLLRPLAPDDWDALYAVASDPLVWEVHPAHNRWQETEFRAFFADALQMSGALAVIDRETGKIIGSSRYFGHDPAGGGNVEIGWTFLARDYWGGSYNRELKRLMLHHAFRFVERVIFMVGERNLRSRRAMEKIGGRLVEQRVARIMADREAQHVCFEITRNDFASGPLAR